jgi:predicted TIM-barrel fold metal-dependent hydrolase
MTEKIWANSGDSHFLEPETLWRDTLPPKLAELVPYTERDPDGQWETVHIDGMAFRRLLPTGKKKEFYEASSRAPGARDIGKRMIDLDQEGIWAELVFPSLGMWSSTFRSPEVLREALKVSNDWAFDAIDKANPRLVSTAQVSTLDIGDAVAELERVAEMGYRAVFMPVKPHPNQEDYNQDVWEPFWAAAEAAKIVIAFHIGTDPIDFRKGAAPGIAYRGPGGAVLNYTDTTFGGQRAVMKLVAACTAMGFNNVMWGSDYPHMEGTYGHTQETLHHLFDGVDPAARHRITIGTFQELFPGTPPLPTPAAA